jgi:uncharacterized membrane protein
MAPLVSTIEVTRPADKVFAYWPRLNVIVEARPYYSSFSR